MKKSMLMAAAALAFAAAPAAGQTIAQGMSRAEVQREFGAPAATREAGEWTYWYYHNGCPRRCGSDDVVFFQNDRVVTAVLRTQRRRYSGPRADDALQATDDGTSGVRVDGDAPAGTAVVGGIRVENGVRVEGGAAPARAGVIVVPAPADDEVRGTPVPAREGRPGEPSTIVIGSGDPQAGTVTAPAATPANVPAVDADDLSPAPADAAADTAPAANAEATDTQGQTSIDRKNQRNQRDRRNEPTATERARRNDRRGNP
jgi:hypothetical protein